MSALSGSEALPPRPQVVTEEPNLGILTEVPLPTRLADGLRKLIRWYFRVRPAFAFIIALAVIWIVSSPARHAISVWWRNGLLIAFLIIACIGLGTIFKRLQGLFVRYTLGPPAFGDAGGLEERLLRATFRAAPDVRLTFSAEDNKRIDDLVEWDTKITEELLRHNFFEKRASGGLDKADIEAQWQPTWQRIQNDPIEQTTYAKIRRDYPYAILTIPLWILGSLGATVVIDFFLLAVVWLGYRWATGMGRVLPIVEITILFSFAISSWLFINRVYRAGKMPFLTPSREGLTSHGITDDALLSAADEIRGLVVRPQEVRLGTRYFREQIAFSIRAVAVDCIFRIVPIALLAGMSLAGAFLLSNNRTQALGGTYLRLILVVAVASIGLVVGYYLASALLLDARRFLAPIVSGFVGAAIPLLGQYVLTGRIGSNPKAVLSSVILGVFSIAATTAAEIVKYRFEGKPGAPENS